TVSGTNSGTNTTLDAGNGNDAITLGNGSHVLDDINGPLTVLGGSGTDTLTLDDTATGTSSVYRSGTAPRSGVAAINFTSGGDLENLVISAGHGNDTLSTSGYLGNGTFSGGTGADELDGAYTGGSNVTLTLSDSQLTESTLAGQNFVIGYTG